MSKFLNKKEQVIDLKLTNYGNHLLSTGAFKPAYYTFLDDNVVYDSAYFGRSAEPQNDINKRIKDDTQYLESLVLFEEVGINNIPDTEMNYFPSDITPTQKQARIDEFRFNSIIGDSYSSENKQNMPSWKLISLRSDIASITEVDNINKTRIPQINITASFFKKIVDRSEYENQTINTSNGRDIMAASNAFADDKIIYLEMSEALLYIEEVNTEVLNENFDIEVFEIQDGDSADGQKLIKKYYQDKEKQVVDGYMTTANPVNIPPTELTENAIENYFSVLVDAEVDEQIACKLSSQFNKDAFLIDLDFDCDKQIRDDLFFDIYGSETEAEICLT